MELNSLLNTSFIFWMVIDPIGNIPIVLSILHSFDPKKQRTILWRELIIALIIMMVFFFFGIGFFSLLSINTAALQMAGSLFLLLFAIRMIFSKPNFSEKPPVTKEPFFVPIAVPLIAGPGILSLISLYGASAIESKITTFAAILIAWTAALPCLLVASYLKKWLGENGLVATERLFGYIIVLLAVQMGLEAITHFFA